ncbi:MAG: methyltransferase domain-containing protein [Deltaproteobacteria bacterium]|nr:methyltransferase domain-containing protein [Deltaproteobacteria bacterium]
MRKDVISYLTCPICNNELKLKATIESSEVISGSLICGGCNKAYPIIDGIPRLVIGDLTVKEEKTSESFGYAWQLYGSRLSPALNREFLERLPPWKPEDFKGQVVLDVGCGAGRLSRLASDFGAREVFALDVGSAVDAAKQLSANYPNIHFIQANLFNPPFKPLFDMVFCIFFLHHTAAPFKAFKAILNPLKEGGKIGVWVYGKEGNEIMGSLLNLIRYFTINLSNSTKVVLSKTMVQMEEVIYKSLTRYLKPKYYGEYLNYLNTVLSNSDRNYIAFDFLSTPIVHYISKQDLVAFVDKNGLKQCNIVQINNNSYGVTAIK